MYRNLTLPKQEPSLSVQGRELRNCESRRLVETERFTVYYLREKIASEKVNSLQPVFDDQTDAWRPHLISCPKGTEAHATKSLNALRNHR